MALAWPGAWAAAAPPAGYWPAQPAPATWPDGYSGAWPWGGVPGAQPAPGAPAANGYASALAPAAPAQAQGAVPAAGGTAPGAASEGLQVHGCRHGVVGGIVNGTFTRLPDLSHGKPVYKRDTQANGLDVHVYFWDDRDGPRFNGWYFGMKVGGDEVWAFHPGKDSPLPPASGWQVPFDGPVDSGFVVSSSSGASSAQKRPAGEASGQPPQKQPCLAAPGQAPPPQLPAVPQLAQPYPQQPMMQPWDIAQQWQQYHLMQQQHMMQLHAQQQQQQQQQQMMAQKKRAEDDRRRQFEDAKRKKEEENKRRLDELIKRAEEDKCVKVIMPIIQKVRVATPESFPDLKKELEDMLEKDKARAGSQFQRLRGEADKALDAAAKCIEMIMARRRLVEEKKAAEEQRRRELDEAARALVDELRDLVERAEAQSQRLTAAAVPLDAEAPADETPATAPLPVGVVPPPTAAAAMGAAPPRADAPEATAAAGEAADGEAAAGAAAPAAVAAAPAPLSSEELLEACRHVEAAGVDAESMTRACTAFVLQKGPEMKRLVPMTTGTDPSDISQTLAQLLQHIRDLATNSEKTMARARAAKGRAQRRIAAEARARANDALFAKYDRDGDGALSRKEVLSYAKGEFDFQLAEEALDRIWRTLVAEGSVGVTAGSFHWLKVYVGTAREVARDRVRVVVREQKEQVLEGVKEVLLEKIKEVGAAVNDADKFVAKVEKQVQPLLAKAKSMPPPEMVSLADETDAMIREARGIAAAVRQRMDTVSEGTSERFQQDVRAYAAQEAKPLHMRMHRMEARLDRATNLSRRFRELAAKRREAECERLRAVALRILRHNRRRRGVGDEELLTASVDEAALIAFFAAADKEVDLAAEAAEEASTAQSAAAAAGAHVPADALAAEAEQWLASELSAAEGGAVAPGAASGGSGAAEAPSAGEAGAPAAEAEAPAAEAEAAPAVEAEAEAAADAEAVADAEAPGAEAMEAAPDPLPDAEMNPAVETVALSEEEVARLFAFLDEEGAGSVSRQTLLERLARS